MAAGITYTPLSTITLSSTASEVSFTSISSSYTDLILITNLKATTGTIYPYLRFNSDSSANYADTIFTGRSTGVTYGNTRINVDLLYLAAYSGADSNDFNYIHNYQIMNYSSTVMFKNVLGRTGNANQGNVDGGIGLWRSTSAITTISVIADSSTFTSGSSFSLYGIAAA